MRLDFGNKIENGGTTSRGKLSPEEFNLLIEVVNEHDEDIIKLQQSGGGGASDLESITDLNTTWVPLLKDEVLDFVTGSDYRLTNSRPASDVFEWAKQPNKPDYTKNEVGLGNLQNYNISDSIDLNSSTSYASSKAVNLVKQIADQKWTFNEEQIKDIKTDSSLSADKLTTSRTLWGKSFDGTTNVTGGLETVEYIKALGDLEITPSNGLGGLTLYNDLSSFSPRTSSINNTDLGTNTSRWKGIYGNNADLTGGVKAGTYIIASGGALVDSGGGGTTVTWGAIIPNSYGILKVAGFSDQSVSLLGHLHSPSDITGLSSYIQSIKVNSSLVADKLTTSRTLWGRPFNGSANVTGSMVDVGDINMNGAINVKTPYGTSTKGLFFINPAYTALGSIGILTTSSGAFSYGYIGWGAQASSLSNNLAVSQFILRYKNNNIIYEGLKLTKALEWNSVNGHSGYVGQVGDNFLISINGSTSNDGLFLNSTTEKLLWRGSELLTTNNITNVDIDSSSIVWGGDNISNGYSALDAALSPTLSANRLQGTATSAISVEYTVNGGLNWLNYNATDKQKKDLFVAGQSADFRLGKRTESGDTISANDKLRVTIDANLAPIYNQFEKFILYLSTEGAQGTTVTIQGSTAQLPNTWVTLTNKQFVNGWSGYNVVNQKVLLDNSAATTPSGRYRYLRFTFEQETSESTYKGLVIRNIQGFGGVGWVTPSNAAAGSYPYKVTTSPYGVTRAAFDMGVGADFYTPKTNGKLILNSLGGGDLSTSWAAIQLYQSYLGKAVGSRTSVDIGSTSDRFTNYYASGLFNTSSSVFNSITTNGGINTESREYGLITAYDVSKITAIWNLSEPYKVAKDGSGFGNLYGLAYYHTNNGKGTFAGGHQVMFVANGSPRVALGDNLWVSGRLISTGTTINGVSDIFTTNIWNTVGDRTASSANRLILSSGAQIANIYHINAAGNQARDLRLGSVSITNKALFYSGYGFKWGIGTEDPTEELDVVGTIRGRGGIKSDSYLIASGAALI